METREFTAKSLAEALDQAALYFGVLREDLEYTVITEGRAGVFGLGAEDARIQVVVPSDEEYEEVSDDEVMDAAREILEQLLSLMHVEASVDIRPTEPGPTHDSSEFTLDVSGEDLGLLIGRRGETLSALQYIVNLMLNRRLGTPVKVSVDVEQYRLRRANSLRTLALRMAERAQTIHQPITLEAMPPHERRLVHLTLRDHPNVSSQSIGEGDSRKVVISPKH